MEPADRIYAYSSTLMGTEISLRLFSPDRQLAAQVFNTIGELENLLTVNRPRSQVMDVNRAAGNHPVAVTSTVFELIRRARDASLVEGSCFNLAIGPIVKLWKIGFTGDSVPDRDRIERLLGLTDPRDVILDEKEGSVFLARAGMEIDIGAIAKGYIADIVKELLRRNGVRNAIVNLGGNLHAIGTPLPEEQGRWRVGLQKPFGEKEEMIGIIRVSDKSVVTSGTYERFIVVDDRIYHHIIDPRTGYPLDNELHSITIVSDKSIDGDVYSTIIYGMGVASGLRYLRENCPSLGAVFVTRDKRIILSSERSFAFELLDTTYSLSRPGTSRSGSGMA